MFYTIYKTTNKINGKIYVGAHKTHDLNDDYLGSGLYLGRAIEKYGLENFEKEILAVFDNKKDMFEMESELVNEDFIENKETYNLKLGGHGGWDHTNGKNNFEDPKIQKKAQINGNIKKRELLNSNKNWTDNYKKQLSNGTKKYYENGGENPFKGKKHSEEFKQKMSKIMSESQKGSGNSQYGTMWIHNLELKESKRIKKMDPIPEGWIKGRKIKFNSH